MKKTVNVPKKLEGIFQKSQDLVRQYFRGKKEDVSRGTIEISGQRYILVRAASMSVEFFKNIKKLFADIDEKEASSLARDLLFDIAHSLGIADAKSFHRQMHLQEPIEKLSAGPVHFAHSGWAFVDILPESNPRTDADFFLLYDHHDSFEAQAWLTAKETTDFPVCVMNAGYSSGWCEESFGITLVASEILCRARGDDQCRFIMAHPDKIKGAIDCYLNGHPHIAKSIARFEETGFFKKKKLQDQLRERERRLAEKELRKTELQYHRLIDTTSEGYWRIDVQFKTIEVNQSLCDILGYSREEIIGRTPYEFVDDDNKAVLLASLAKIYEKDQRSFEIVLQKKNGDPVPTYFNATTIHDDSGQAVGSFALVSNITGQKKTQEALRKSEERYRTLFDEVPVGLYRTKPSGQILEANLALVNLLGYPDRPSFLAMNAIDFYVNPNERRQFQTLQMQEGIVRNFEVQFQKRDGTRIWIRNNSHAVKDHLGEIRFYEGTIEDVSERRILEQQLLQTQKMESIGTLASGIAHDFNNLLSVITNSGSLMRMKMGEKNPLEPSLKYILDAAQRASLLTKSLLAFSRKQTVEPKPINFNAIVTGMATFLQRLLGEDIRLTIELIPTDINVFADQNQIELVLLNLASNSRDAMPHGGDLAVKTTLIDVAPALARAHHVHPGKYAMISMSDTGSGIDDRIIAQIFDPFFTTKDVGKGTGLGLSIVYGIVKQLNGFIDVHSEPGITTTFKIYLPILKRPLDGKGAGAEPTVVGGKETILLVEDEAAVRETSKQVLETFGYTVLVASDGEEAIAKFSQFKEVIQLVIMDLIMPKKNGQQAYREILQFKADAKVIFVSGYPYDIIMQRGLLQEGQCYVAKPIIPSELLQMVRLILDA